MYDLKTDKYIDSHYRPPSPTLNKEGLKVKKIYCGGCGGCYEENEFSKELIPDGKGWFNTHFTCIDCGEEGVEDSALADEERLNEIKEEMKNYAEAVDEMYRALGTAIRKLNNYNRDWNFEMKLSDFT